MPELYVLQAEKPAADQRAAILPRKPGGPSRHRLFRRSSYAARSGASTTRLMPGWRFRGRAYLGFCAGKLGKARPATSLPETTAVRAYKRAASAEHFREQRMTDDLVKLKKQPDCRQPVREGSAGEASHPDTVERATESASTPCDEYVFPVIFPTKNGKAFIRSVGGLYRSSPARCTTPS